MHFTIYVVVFFSLVNVLPYCVIIDQWTINYQKFFFTVNLKAYFVVVFLN